MLATQKLFKKPYNRQAFENPYQQFSHELTIATEMRKRGVNAVPPLMVEGDYLLYKHRDEPTLDVALKKDPAGVGKKLGLALARLHTLKDGTFVIHGDLNPKNVLIGEGAIFIDLEYAKIVKNPEAKLMELWGVFTTLMEKEPLKAFVSTYFLFHMLPNTSDIYYELGGEFLKGNNLFPNAKALKPLWLK